MKELVNVVYAYFKRIELLKEIKKYGKCEIQEDKIVCIVSGRKLKRKFRNIKGRNTVGYDIFLHNAGKISDPHYQETRKKIGLDKPIVFIIKNVKFDKPIDITSINIDEIIFEECTFTSKIDISYAEEITFENNTYKCTKHSNPNVACPSFTLKSAKTVKSIKFTNDSLVVYSNSGSPMNLDLRAETIKFCGLAEVCIDGNFFVEGQNLIIQDESDIYADDVHIRTNNSCCVDDSSIWASKSLNIETGCLDIKNSSIEVADDACVKADNVQCDGECKFSVDKAILVDTAEYDERFAIILNASEIIWEKDKKVLSPENVHDDLHEKRLLLLGTLRKISDKCYDRPIAKVLRKGTGSD